MSLDGRRSMSLGRVSVQAITPEVAARPGDVTVCRVRVRNDGPTAIPLFVRVHGLGQSSPYVPIAGPPVAPDTEVDVEVPLEVPETFGVGAHSLAIEIGSGKPDDRSALAKVVLSIGAPAGITARIEPGLVRGGRRARFAVEVQNTSTVPADVTLRGSGPDLRVAIEPDRVRVPAGATTVVRGKVRGPRRWVGDPAIHVLTVEARGGSVPRLTTASFRQRAVVPRRARGGLIGVALVALWALLATAVVLVWTNRDDRDDAATEQTTDRGNLPPLTDPDGSPAGGGTGGGGPGGAGGGGGAGSGGSESPAASARTDTIVRGTVKAGGTGDDDGVLVTLTPTIPGETRQLVAGETSAPAGQQAAAMLQPGGPGQGMRVVPAARPGNADGPPTKFWPERYGTYRPNGLDNLRTLSVASVNSDVDGSWRFEQVPLRQSYEVSFAKPGFTTQSFIVSPPEDGKPVELEVELEPGDGALGGVVSGPSGAAEVTITDGTLTFNTTTSTDARTQGRWAVGSLSTPGTYTITVTSHGFGTEVMQVHLDPGEERAGLDVRLRPNVGSISGTVSSGGLPLGGVTLVAASGDQEIATTSLTEGATGTYHFPQLELGSTYTITASADGYVTQTRSVTVGGNTSGIDFSLVKATATIVGRVLSAKAGTTAPLVSAAVSVTAGDLQVRTSSAAAPDAGAFSVTDLPPGSYVLAASRYDHPEVSQLVTLTAGQVFDAGDIVLGYQARPPLTAEGSLVVRTVDSFNAPLTGATVQLIDVGGTIATQSKTMSADESSVSFTAVPIGTYNVRVTKPNYRPGTINQLTIGLGPVERQLTMLQYGTARGTVVDAVAGYTTVDPIYVTDADPETPIVFDPSNEVVVPPEEQVGPGAVKAFRTTAPAPGGRLVVQYANGTLFYDANDDGVPESLLTLLRIGSRPLSGYELLLYRLDGTNPVCIGAVPESGDEWEIDPSMQLLSGNYALRFAPLGAEVGTACAGRGRLPDGFATMPVDDAGNVATFTVADNLDQKILVAPIRVGPYPRIDGRLLVPEVVAGNVEFKDFGAEDAEDLAVRLDCDAGSLDATIAPAGDAITFTIGRPQFASLYPGVAYDRTTGDLATCTLRAEHTTDPGFIPVERAVTLRVGLEPPAYQDHYVSVALVDDPGIIVGTVLWRDLGAPIDAPSAYPVSFASVTSDTDVIVGFTPTDEADPSDPDDPLSPVANPDDARIQVSAGADSSGAFAFAVPGERQVLGTSDYTVSGTPFGSQAMRVQAVADDWTASDPAPAPPDPPRVVDHGDNVDVFLQPDPGTLTGAVQVISHRGTRAALGEDALTVTGTPPGGDPSDPLDFVLTDAGPDRVAYAPEPNSAAAGTWRVNAAAAAASNLYLTQSATTAFVPPDGAGSPETELTAVELGQIDVRLRSSLTKDISGEDVEVHVDQLSGVATVPADFARLTESPDATGRLAFGRLPVGRDQPLADEIIYRVTADIPNHDLPTSTVTVVRINPDGSDGPSTTLPTGALQNGIEVGLRAGERVRLEALVPAYGTLQGRLDGRVTPTGVDPAVLEDLPIVPGGARVLAIRQSDQVEIDLQPADPDDPDAAFSLRVPANTYTLVFSAPGYVSQTLENVVVEADQDTTRNAVLALQTRAYQLTAIDGIEAGADPVAEADVGLWWGAYNPLDPPSGTAFHPGATGDDGLYAVDGVYPGTYTLVVRKRVAGSDANFPVIATVTIPRAPGSVTHRVVMPIVGGSIEGDVIAISESTGREVALPPGIKVTRAYTMPTPSDPDVPLNEATESDLVPAPQTEIDLIESEAGDGAHYEFHHLPYGDHTLTFSPAGGYTVSFAGNPIAVPRDQPVDVTYRALSVDVAVTVVSAAAGSPAVADATVSLVPSVDGQATPGDPSTSGNVHTFASVAPDLAPYTLHVEAPGFLPHDGPLTVTPSATPHGFTIELTPLTTITGFAKTSSPAELPFAGTVHLVDDEDDVIRSVPTDGSTGEFVFELEPDEVGVYRVRFTLDGYEPGEAKVNGDLPVAVGATYELGDVIAYKYATAFIDVTVAGDGDLADVQGLALVVTPPTGSVTVSGPTDGRFSVGGLEHDTDYVLAVTSTTHAADPETLSYKPTAGGEFGPVEVELSPKPATATVRYAGGSPPTGAALSVDPSTGLTITGPTDGAWTVTGLTHDADGYTFRLTAPGYAALEWHEDFEPGEPYETEVALQLLPGAAFRVAGGASIAGLSLVVAPNHGTVTPSTDAGDRIFRVTGLTPGEEYSFTIRSTNYEDHVVPWPSAVAGQVFGGDEPAAAITLTAKPATVSITMVGAAAAVPDATVSANCSPASVSGTRTPSTDTWVFSVPVGNVCTFTGSATGYEPATTSSYTANVPNGVHTASVTPTLIVVDEDDDEGGGGNP